MHEHQADVILISKVLQLCDNFVIAGVTVRIAADFPYFLQRVDNDKRRVLMLSDEAGKLLIQTFADLICLNGKIEPVRFRCAEHPVEPFLQSPVIIFECEVQHRSAPHRILP